jgi:hypothetical protein
MLYDNFFYWDQLVQAYLRTTLEVLEKLKHYKLLAGQPTNGDEGTTQRETSLACEPYAHLHDLVWQGYLTVVEATTKVAVQYTEVIGRELGVSVPRQVTLLVQQGDHLATCLEHVIQRLERLEGYATVHTKDTNDARLDVLIERINAVAAAIAPQVTTPGEP